MGSRTWIKIYCDKWISGTIRTENLQVQAIFISLLCLAGAGEQGDSGVISYKNDVGLPDSLIENVLKISHKDWKFAKKRLVETDRIIINPGNVISINNWAKYQSEYTRLKPYKSTTKSTENSTLQE